MPDYGSLTKEFPLASVEQTIAAITPSMRYPDLRQYARANTRPDIPGLLRKRFLLVDASQRIVYDEFLALVKREGVDAAVTRKVMLFTWLYRDDRLRRFIIERASDANGHWNPAKLTDKKNSDFFEQWYSSGGKARSNFEYFLVETGIYRNTSRSAHLELDDGWLEDAARVAAQHEQNPEIRRQLSENPYKFLVDRGWNALVNATSSELLLREPNSSFAADPVEDDLIPADPTKTSPSKTWNRPKPLSSEKASTEALVNLVARERANQSHHAIEEALAQKITQGGYDPKYNDHIDLFYTCDAGSVIVEVKSCTQNNIHAQVRKGLSQLYEYRYIFASDLIAPIHLLLALEIQPSAEKRWLIDYLQSIGIIVSWIDMPSGEFKTSSPSIGILAGIVHAQG